MHYFRYFSRGDQRRGIPGGRAASLSVDVRAHRVSARRDGVHVGRGRGGALRHVSRRQKPTSAARIRRALGLAIHPAITRHHARRRKYD